MQNINSVYDGMQNIDRRSWLSRVGNGFGGLALASMLAQDGL
jgi:hypothetical protein